MTNETTAAETIRCSYCGGASGNLDGPDHNVLCPRFLVADVGTEGLDALRDGARNPSPAPFVAAPRLTPAEVETARRVGRSARERFDAAIAREREAR